MNSELTVRALRKSETGKAAAMLARAFWDDLLCEVVAPDLAHRERMLRWFFGANVRYGLLYGETLAAYGPGHSLKGVAVWWAPEFIEPDEERAVNAGLADGLLVVGPTAWSRLADLMDVMAELHHTVAPEPHWYLAILGVEPDAQGQGIGGRLLQPRLTQCDAEGIAAYLETTQERSIPFYERQGFQVHGDANLPSTGTRLWALRRDPR